MSLVDPSRARLEVSRRGRSDLGCCFAYWRTRQVVHCRREARYGRGVFGRKRGRCAALGRDPLGAVRVFGAHVVVDADRDRPGLRGTGHVADQPAVATAARIVSDGEPQLMLGAHQPSLDLDDGVRAGDRSKGEAAILEDLHVPVVEESELREGVGAALDEDVRIASWLARVLIEGRQRLVVTERGEA